MLAHAAKACPRVHSSAHSRICRRALATQSPRTRRPQVTCQAEATEAPPALNLWQRYCLRLETHPTQTKAFTSLIGFTLGDILAQFLEGAPNIDFVRTSHLAFYGFFLDGPIGHQWYKWLDGTCDKVFENPKGTGSVATKTAADQLIWAPVMTCAFFAVLKLLEGSPEEIVPTLQQKVIPTVAANYVIWPAAHVISFKFVPSQQRILYNNVVAIFWNAYMSLVAADGGIAALGIGAGDTLNALEAADTAADLVGLNDVAASIKNSMPLEMLFDDLLQFGSPMVQRAAEAAGESGMSSPFVDAVLRMQRNMLQ